MLSRLRLSVILSPAAKNPAAHAPFDRRGGRARPFALLEPVLSATSTRTGADSTPAESQPKGISKPVRGLNSRTTGTRPFTSFRVTSQSG